MLIQTASLDRNYVSDTMITTMLESGFSLINEGMGLVHLSGEVQSLHDFIRRHRLKVIFWSSERETKRTENS